MKLNHEEVMKVLPHRDPMLLVDEVLEMEEGKSVVTKFYVDPEREIFKGHFPGDPVLPGVYTVEVMAQSADVLFLSMEKYKGLTPLFIGINNVKFLAKILPGDTIETHAVISFEKPEKAIGTCTCESYVNGKLAATGEVSLAMR